MRIDTRWRGSIRAFEQTVSCWSSRDGRLEIPELQNEGRREAERITEAAADHLFHFSEFF